MTGLAEVPPDRMCHPEHADLHRYAALCRHLHPGALGEFVAREFEQWALCGYRADPGGQLYRVAADLDAQAERRLRTERERWAPGSVSKPPNSHPAPVTPPPPVQRGYGRAECHCGAFGSDNRP